MRSVKPVLLVVTMPRLKEIIDGLRKCAQICLWCCYDIDQEIDYNVRLIKVKEYQDKVSTPSSTDTGTHSLVKFREPVVEAFNAYNPMALYVRPIHRFEEDLSLEYNTSWAIPTNRISRSVADNDLFLAEMED